MGEVKVYGRLEGEQKFLRELREMADNKLKERVSDAILKGGETVAEEARRRAPVDSGRLRDSIKVKQKKRRDVQHVGVTVEADYPANAGVRKTKTRKQAAGSKEYYAFALEYGTRHMAAQPFLNPALAAKADEVYGLVQKALEALGNGD